MGALLGLGVGLRALPLLGHQPAEALLVDLQALLGGHLEGQVDREAVGVVQLERLVAGEDRCRLDAAFTSPAARSKMLVPALRVGAERVLLGVGDGGDPLPVGEQVGVGLAHLVAADRQQLGQARVVVPEQPHRPDDAPREPAQDVATALVAGGHTVVDQHHRRADVVGDDPEPDVVDVVGAVPLAGELLGLLDDGEHDVDLVHVLRALEQEGDALETHAGVDVLLRQGARDVEVLLAADGGELVLHEDQVPDLEVAVLELGGHREPLGGRELAVRAVVRPAVVEDLRARATRVRARPSTSSSPSGRA